MSHVGTHLEAQTSPDGLPTKLRSALAQLAEAYDYARDADRDLWDFAVEIDVLGSAGLGRSDLRWLVHRDYVEHAHETTLAGDATRTFRPGSAKFSKRTCFVLTAAGLTLARSIADGNGQPPPPLPHWDSELRELRVGGQLVKRFKTPAPNQQVILAALEEEGWPPRVDDPLPPQPEQESKLEDGEFRRFTSLFKEQMMKFQVPRFPRLFVLSPLVVVAVLITWPQRAPAAEAKDPAGTGQAFRVTVREEQGMQKLIVGGQTIAQSKAALADVKVAKVPRSKTMFATWVEQTDEARTPYFALNLKGERWTAPKATSYHILLKHGAFDPLEMEAEAPEPLPAMLVGEPESRLFLVQFATQGLEEYRKEIRELGGEVHAYIPNHCHLVRMDPNVAEAVRELPFVRWVGPMHPAFKLDKALVAKATPENVEEPNKPDDEAAQRYDVVLVSKNDRRTLLTQIEELGGKVLHPKQGSVVVVAELNSKQLYNVARLDSVQWVELWTPIEEDMDNARRQGGANYIENLPPGYTGIGIRGHVMEGIYKEHPDFAANPHRVAPIPIFDGDPAYHGNSTFGIVFGDGTHDPESKARGLLPNAQGFYTHYKAVNGVPPISRYELVRQLVEDHQVMFQTASWGNGRTKVYTNRSADMDDLIFDHDVPITQSQSNAGDQMSRPQAWAKNIISVGGVYHYDNSDPADDRWNDGASIGPASDGRIKPDLCAFYDRTRTTHGPSGYHDFGGTSGATPMVAGHVGLCLEMWTNGIFGNSLPSPGGTRFQNRPHFTTVKALLICSARQYEFSGTAHDLARCHQGWGFPDLERLHKLRNKVLVVNEDHVLENLQSREYLIEVASGEPVLKITMTYADPAGSVAAAQQRINNLDLSVTDPGGITYWGNHGLMENMFSTPGGTPNSIDTVENVFVEDPLPGTWKVKVIADELNADGHPETPGVDADYALVALGVTLKTPAPRFAYLGSRGDHHLAGDTGTGLYCWKGDRWLVNLVYDRSDKCYWYYHEKEYPDYKWAFARKPHRRRCYSVWFMPDGETNNQWVRYQYACRVTPVNADAKAAESRRK